MTKNWAQIVLKKNTDILCGFYEDSQNSLNQNDIGSCFATMALHEDMKVFHARNVGIWEWWGPTRGTTQGNTDNVDRWW